MQRTAFTALHLKKSEDLSCFSRSLKVATVYFFSDFSILINYPRKNDRYLELLECRQGVGYEGTWL